MYLLEDMLLCNLPFAILFQFTCIGKLGKLHNRIGNFMRVESQSVTCF